MEHLLLRIAPNGIAEAVAQRRFAGREGAKIPFGVEFGCQPVDRVPLAQGARFVAVQVANRVDYPKVIPGQELVDRIELARIGP